MKVTTAAARIWVVLAAMALLTLPFAGAASASVQEPPTVGHEQEPQSATEEHAAEGEHAAEQEHAAEGEHGEEHEETSWTEYAMKWTNFVLLLALLYWLLVTPPAFVKENFEFEGLQVVLASRAEGILAASALATEQREEAQRTDRESAERLAKIEQEATGLVVRAREEAVGDGERIAAAAGEEAEKIRSGASRDMKTEVERARRALRTHVADLAVSIATRLVRDNISAEDQDRMVRQYLDRLGDSVS